VKFWLLLVTSTHTTAGACGGDVHIIVVDEITVVPLDNRLPNLHVAFDTNAVPLIVTVVLPMDGPEIGRIVVM